MAEAADASGNSDLAISMYAAAASSEPSNSALQLRYADALVRNGKVAEAQQMLTERLRTRPNQPDLIRVLALIDLVSGEPERAAGKFDEILAVDPGDIRSLVDKAVALDLLGQHAAAQAIYHRVLATAPKDAATTNDLAISLLLEGRSHQALETLAPLQEADSLPPRLKVNLGILYAANADGARSQRLLGGHLSDDELSKLKQGLASFAVEGNSLPASHISTQRPAGAHQQAELQSHQRQNRQRGVVHSAQRQRHHQQQAALKPIVQRP